MMPDERASIRQLAMRIKVCVDNIGFQPELQPQFEDEIRHAVDRMQGIILKSKCAGTPGTGG